MIDMKRVIYLSWLRDMKRRLQEMTEGTDKIDLLYEQTTTEKNNENTTEKRIEEHAEEHDENKKANFRFPIVSDYEIYGWEPQVHQDEHTKDYLQEETEEQRYEIIPLEDNERWPGRYGNGGTIYRAETKRDFAHIIPPTSEPLPLPFSGRKHERTQHSEPQRIEPLERMRANQQPQTPPPTQRPEEPVKQDKPKKIRRPFTPTAVPSPIYGLRNSSPISEAMEAVIEKNESKDDELHEQLDVQTQELPLSLISSQYSDESPLFASSTEKQQSDSQMIKESPELVEEPSVDEVEPLAEELEEPLSIHEEIEEIIEQARHSTETEEQQVEEPEYVAPETQQPTIKPTEEVVVSEELVEPQATEVKEVEQIAPQAQEVVAQANDETEEIFIEPQETVVFSVEDQEPAEEEQEEWQQPAEPELDFVEPQYDPTETEEVLVDSEESITFTTEEVESEVDEVEPEAIEQPELPKKEKVVPFNVLMLKSDKEKMNAKIEELIAASAAKQEPVGDESTEVETAQQTVIEDVEPIVVEPSAQQPEIIAEATETIVEEPEEIIEEEPPHYGFPSMQYLAPPEEEIIDQEWLDSQSVKLEEALSHFAIRATVEQAVQGPAVTMFQLKVEQGVKVSKIRSLTDDLKLALAARDIRIQAPIPGTSMIGIEIPNRTTRAVRISEVIDSDAFRNSSSPLEAVLGLSLTGEPQTIDLRKMPHGMIAGATGSGKSVCINSILISLLYKSSHHDLRLLLIDPKMVELAPYNGIPHLLSPVITDVKAATAALKWAVNEMERRYELFAHSSVRDIERYNKLVMESRRFSLKMPYIVVVIDELADLMMMAPADVEVSISRITQKARACGIHLIIATQRPSVDVITGTIKANIPTRIAFAVSSQVDSRTILDSVGADRLLGKGDMLYLGNGQSAPVRLQGTFVTDDEIESVIEHVSNEAEPNYLFGQDDLLAAAIQEEESDPLFEQACTFVIEQGSASTSALQRHFSIGYNRAAKLIDRMEANQFISEQRGSRARDVFLTEQAFESFMK